MSDKVQKGIEILIILKDQKPRLICIKRKNSRQKKRPKDDTQVFITYWVITYYVARPNRICNKNRN